MGEITKGMQLIADWSALLIKAVEKGNPDALQDAIAVARAWRAETVDVLGRVRVSPLSVLFSDPWFGSRAALRAFSAKWSGLI